MKMKWSAGLLVVVLLMAFLFGGGCQPAAPQPAAPQPTAPQPAEPAEPAEPIVIGALFPFSGAQGAYGPKFSEGIELALDEVGRQVLGRPVEIIYEDSAANPVAGLEKAKKLVEVDGVNLIIGPLFGHVILAIADYLIDHDVIAVGLKTTPLDYSEPQPVIGFPTTDQTLGYPWGLYAAEVEGYKTATTLYSDYAYGHNYQDGFKRGFEEKGGRVIQEQWPPLGNVDFGPYLTALDQQSDVFVMWAPAGDQMKVVTQYLEFGLLERLGPMMIGANSLWLEQLEEIGDRALGMKGLVDYTFLIDTPVNKSFVEKFEAKYGRLPEIEECNAYEATLLTLAAIEVAGGDDNRAELWEAFVNLEMNLPAGPVSFTPTGAAIKTLYIAEVARVDGKMVYVPIKEYPAVQPLDR